MKELKRLARMSLHHPESGYIRTWLDAGIDMPWSLRSENNTTIQRAEKVLNEDHYALKEVKERVVEYLSVLKLKQKKEKTKDGGDKPSARSVASGMRRRLGGIGERTWGQCQGGLFKVFERRGLKTLSL